MRVLIALTLDLPDVKVLPGILNSIDPPNVPYFAGEVRVAVEPHVTELLAYLDGADTLPTTPSDDHPAPGQDQTADEMLDRNRANLQTGLVKARRVWNAIKRGQDSLTHEAMQSLVVDFIKPLNDADREQLVVNGLMAAVQLQDELTTTRAFSGNVKGKR